MEMGAEQFGPFAIDPSWRRRGPTATPGVIVPPPAAPAAESPPSPATSPILRLVETPPMAPMPAVEEFAPLAEAEAAPVPEVTEFIVPVEVSPPRPEEVPARTPFKPDPVPVVVRERRGLGDALMPYLAALVGLIALGGAIYLDQLNQTRFAGLTAEIGQLKVALDAHGSPTTAAVAQAAQPATAATDPATIAVLEQRIAALEQTPRAAVRMTAPGSPVVSAPTDDDVTGSIDTAATPSPATKPAADEAKLVTKFADHPTKDCIPVGTRFVATPGDSFPICRTTEVVKVRDVTLEGVLLTSGKMVGAGESSTLKFGQCALNVVASDGGFADLKVTCT